jgi:hypothetical protein
MLFAQQLKMPVSLCTFCGKIYLLEDSKGRSNTNASSCGSVECKKALRKQKDKNKRRNPKVASLIREQEKQRKRRQRLKQKAINLYHEGHSKVIQSPIFHRY